MHRLADIARLEIYFLGNAFKWNLLHPLILPLLVWQQAPAGWKNTMLGLLTFGGLALAAIFQPLMGTLSDRLPPRSRFMRLGGVLDAFFLLALGFLIPRLSAPARGLAGLLVVYIGLQLASNLTQGPAQGLVPELVARERLGTASGLKNMYDMLGLALAALLGGRLLAADGHNLPMVILLITGGYLLTLSISLYRLPSENTPSAPQRLAATDLWRATFSLPQTKHRGIKALILQRFFFLVGIYGLQAFIQFYLRDVLHAPNPLQQTGDLLAALTAVLTVLAVLGGWLSDRMAPQRLLYLAGGMSFFGYLLAPTARTLPQLIGWGTLIGGGLGLFMAVNWAQVNRLAPVSEAGRYLGLTNLATAGAAALARLLGPVIDGLNAIFPHALPGYWLLFWLGASGSLAAISLIRRQTTGTIASQQTNKEFS